ncbi:MAG: ZIP family metal transporter [Bacteroidales bacterium]
MDQTLTYIIIAALIGSVGSILLAGGILLIKDKKLALLSERLTSFAGGTLMGAAFLGMIPRAMHTAPSPQTAGLTIIGGIIFFFILEKIILWRICRDDTCHRADFASVPIILVGDAFHNFVDGIVIAVAFMTDTAFGIIVTVSVFAHEIPQELADFGILINHGMSRLKALYYNMLSGITTLLGAGLAYWTLEKVQSSIPYVLSISAASFVYIALADLIPQMHKSTKVKESLIQIGLMLLGVGVIYLTIHFKHNFHLH